jgi:hypothetical protein
MTTFSKFIIYADESGSPNLGADNRDFPIFVLNFLVVEKRVYTHDLVPPLQSLKFNYFGHDQIILHERDIRRQSGAFVRFRANADQRGRLLESIAGLVATRNAQFACAIIDKRKIVSEAVNPWSPYDIALGICMETAAHILVSQGEEDTDVHVIFEARGKKEDELLELEFRRVAAGDVRVSFGASPITRFQWTPVFADKRSNSSGLQIADLAARPLGLSYLRPTQPNRAFSAMRLTSAEGGIKVYP